MSVWPREPFDFDWTPDQTYPFQLTDRPFLIAAADEHDARVCGLIHVGLLLLRRRDED